MICCVTAGAIAVAAGGIAAKWRRRASEAEGECARSARTMLPAKRRARAPERAASRDHHHAYAHADRDEDEEHDLHRIDR